MMTNGPNARIGRIMEVDIPRPRTRRALLEHPRYYEYRQELLDFLDEYEHGAAGRPAARGGGVRAAHERVARHRRQWNGGGGLVEKLAARALGRYAIAVIGDEPRLAYNRVLLVVGAGGRRRIADIELKPAGAGGATAASPCSTATRATAIDRVVRRVKLASGEQHLPIRVWCSPPVRARSCCRARARPQGRHDVSRHCATSIAADAGGNAATRS